MSMASRPQDVVGVFVVSRLEEAGIAALGAQPPHQLGAVLLAAGIGVGDHPHLGEARRQDQLGHVAGTECGPGQDAAQLAIGERVLDTLGDGEQRAVSLAQAAAVALGRAEPPALHLALEDRPDAPDADDEPAEGGVDGGQDAADVQQPAGDMVGPRAGWVPAQPVAVPALDAAHLAQVAPGQLGAGPDVLGLAPQLLGEIAVAAILGLRLRSRRRPVSMPAWLPSAPYGLPRRRQRPLPVAAVADPGRRALGLDLDRQGIVAAAQLVAAALRARAAVLARPLVLQPDAEVAKRSGRLSIEPARR
jgi:hypothetical protein